jgi:sterol desaturase/sphingolipid hydroxylase (fatty acid hydroxylase superfamily)
VNTQPHDRIILAAVSWASTFARFQPGRIPLVGPIVLSVADWSRPQTGFAPMFESPQLFERLSVVHPAVPTALYLPAGVWLVWRGAAPGLGALPLALCYGFGLVAWSLLEYGAHRGSFHHEPTTRLQVAYAYLVHGVHHAYPDDSRRWMMPLVITVPIALVLYALFAITLGRFAAPVFGGFLHGYLTYDLLHYFIHRGRMPTRLGRYLRQYHLVHHYKTPERHFGVSSPLWDVVFRTR